MTVAGAASILRNFRQTETELGHALQFVKHRKHIRYQPQHCYQYDKSRLGGGLGDELGLDDTRKAFPGGCGTCSLVLMVVVCLAYFTANCCLCFYEYCSGISAFCSPRII